MLVHIRLSKFADISKTAVAKLEVVDISRKVVLFAERGKLTVHEYQRESYELTLKFVMCFQVQLLENILTTLCTVTWCLRRTYLFLFSEPPPISSKSFVYKLYNAQQKPVMEVRTTSDKFQMYRNTLVIGL